MPPPLDKKAMNAVPERERARSLAALLSSDGLCVNEAGLPGHGWPDLCRLLDSLHTSTQAHLLVFCEGRHKAGRCRKSYAKAYKSQTSRAECPFGSKLCMVPDWARLSKGDRYWGLYVSWQFWHPSGSKPKACKKARPTDATYPATRGI